jgi:hypothetical protein
MAKLPKKLDLSQSFRLGVPEPEPSTVPEPVAEKPDRHRKQRVAIPEGCKSITFYPTTEGWTQVRIIAAQEQRTAQDLMLEALDLWFEKRGLQRCARRAGA